MAIAQQDFDDLNVDIGARADDKILVYKTATSTHVYEAKPAGGGGGFTMTYFQSTKSGDSSMSTSWADITGWLTPTHTHADYSFNTSTGVLTINTAGDYEVTAHLLVPGGSNRSETGVRVLKNGGTIAGCESRNYSSRNTSQNEGAVSIPGFIVSCAATDVLKVQGIYVGTATVAAARGTYFQAKKIG